MSQTDPKANPMCAFCKRWEGDAKLTNQGVAKGFVRFDGNARGVCASGPTRNVRIATHGRGCKDYAISVEADRFV